MIRVDDFTPSRQPSEDEVRIYTWKDATLQELTTLLSSAIPEKYQESQNTTLYFRLIYGDRVRGRYVHRDIGHVYLHPDTITNNLNSTSKFRDAAGKTLGNARFIIGDWIDVAISMNDDLRPQHKFGGSNSKFPRGSSFRGRDRDRRPLPPRERRFYDDDRNYR